MPFIPSTSPSTEKLHIKISRQPAHNLDIQLPASIWPRLQEVMPESGRTAITSEYGDFDHFRRLAEASQPTRDEPYSFQYHENQFTIWFEGN